ncbi:hypothetical protein ACLQ2Q_20735 [Microbacterium sp. DT81.1]|uniref:hypothetical protein n=1 Tax=Microbacterium sp. DT81.1 TaxID=3393413 RepID=UPI003CF3F17D
MSRVESLFKVESFRGTVAKIVALPDDQFQAVFEKAVRGYDLMIASPPTASGTEVLERALGILYETAVREGAAEVIADIRAAMPDAEPSALARLERALQPGPDDLARIDGLSERDAYLPILTSHIFAVDLRVVAQPEDATHVVPLAIARLRFDDPVGNGNSSVVFQITPGDLEGLIESLTELRTKVSGLMTNNSPIIVPGWAHVAADS